MKVKEAMNPEVALIQGDKSIKTAMQTMKTTGTDTMPVVFGNHITGMITDRDIDAKVFAKGLDPQSIRVSDGMSEKLFVCGEDDKIDKAVKKMKRC